MSELSDRVSEHIRELIDKSERIETKFKKLMDIIDTVEGTDDAPTPGDISRSILNIYNFNGEPGIQGSKVERAIQCYLFGQNCIKGSLNGPQIQKIIKEYLFG